LHRDVIITEKIDGTNALIEVTQYFGIHDLLPDVNVCDNVLGKGERLVRTDEGVFGIRAGSRKRWITPRDDNYGFAAWVYDNAAELAKLGPGNHYGEWYGRGIQRGYGLTERRFALFNASRWIDDEARPACCDVVPILHVTTADNLNEYVDLALFGLKATGSVMVPGFERPEGIVVYHTASGHLYKVLIENDNRPKGQAA
jgi:hypothetical protein